MIDEKLIRDALQVVLHPKLKKSLIDIGMIRNISIKDDVVTLALALKNEKSPLREVFAAEIKKVADSLPEVSIINVEFETLSKEECEQLFPKVLLKGIEKVKCQEKVLGGLEGPPKNC